MGLNTDFNQTPYYDDFNEDNNFHRVLFKPGVALQAREITQLQTILQNQVERFGNNILKEGTVVQGCNFTEVRDLKYVKILDLNADGQPVPIGNYVGAKIVGASTGVAGIIQTYADGLESQDPNLNTLFLKYSGSGTNPAIKTFDPTENLEIRYVGNNTLIDTVTAAGSVLDISTDAVGDSYGVRVGEGIIYQKGFFTRIDPQLIIVPSHTTSNNVIIADRYTNFPNNTVVGFVTEESIVTSDADTSLLDNANGFNNYQAPGADRLKLTPSLTAMSKDAAVDDENFFAIQEYMYGKVVRRNSTTQYNGIMTAIEQRTKEESGNYVVKNFSLNTSDDNGITDATDVTVGKTYIISTVGSTNWIAMGAPSNQVGVMFTVTAVGTGTGECKLDALNLDIGAGLAYVEGKRVELLNKISVDLPKSDTYDTELSQTVSTNYGNYILVKEYMGYFAFNKAATVNLYNAVQNDATTGNISSANGSVIGTAKVMSIEYDSGTIGSAAAIYRMYISDVKMTSNNSWSNVKSIAYGTSGTADLVDTTIYDQSFKRRLFAVGRDALKALPAATTSAEYIYRSVTNIIDFANTGNIVTPFTPPAGTWPYSGVLSSIQKKDFLLIPSSNSSPYVKDRPIDLSSATMTVTGDDLSIAIPSCATAMTNCTLYYNAKRTALTNPTHKALETVYVKINCSNNAATSMGPWSLGFPDVYKIQNVYVGSGGSYPAENASTDKTSYFTLNNNQKDDYYGLSTISKRSGLSLTSGSTMIVKLTRFKKTDENGFFSISSYPIDDVNTANTSAIQTATIPTYISSNNFVYDLRDVVDFRPYSVNTAANAASSSSATINPSATITFNTGSELYLPAPNESLNTDYSYYLARKDYLMIDGSGNIVLKMGTPADSPIPPRDPSNGMVIADINVPEYPSLSSSSSARLNKRRYGVSIRPRQHRRYTMEDIGQIDSRIDRLEYYSALSLLETDTKELLITDSTGANRFKNGILVDNFNDLLGADLIDPDYSAGYDISTQEIVPKFREYPLHLKKDTTASDTNVRYYRDSLTLLDTNNFKIIDQQYATYHTTTTINTTVTNGYIQIYPHYDLGKDTIIAPEPVGQADYMLWDYSAGGNTVKYSKYQKLYDTYKQKAISTVTETYTKLSDYSSSGYARPQDIRIKVTGLKPKTKYWVFVNGIAQNVLPGHYTSGTSVVSIATGYGTRDTSEALHGDWVHDISAFWGGTEGREMGVLSDSKGEMLAVLYLPPNTLKVGKHTIQVYEKDVLPSQPTGVATAIYSAYSDGKGVGFTAGIETPMAPISFVTGSSNTEVQTSINDTASSEHIAQTFTLKRSMGKDSVIEVDTIDLYFKSKPVSSTGRGITVNICGTRNNQPDPTDILGSKYLHNSEVFVSDTAATKTTVAFDELIVLKTDATYCVVIIADVHDPDYRAWIARAGDKDVIKQITVTKDAFTGSLYSSTNGTSWTANATDSLKFTVYKNEYVQSGIAYLTNNDHEFLTIEPTGITYVDNKGHTFGDRFKNTETVVKITANLTPTIVTSTSNNVVATSASLLSSISVGDWIGYYHIDSNSNLVVDAAKVVNASSTTLTLDRVPKYANSAAKVFKTVVGHGAYYNKGENILHLADSSFDRVSTLKFEAGDRIWGISSSCTADIVSVDALSVSLMQGAVEEYNYSYTNTKYTLDFIAGNFPYTRINTDQPISLVDEIPYHKYSSTIPSKSLQSEQKFRIKAQLNNTSTSAPYDSTPIIHFKKGLINVFEHLINNDSTDETLPSGGNALTKYISKQVTLAENIDAEDIRVYLTAYRPAGATIEVYARFKNKNDQRPSNEIEWTKLTLKDSSNLTSSVSDLFNYKEFEYNMPTAAAIPTSGAVLDTTNDNKLSYKDPDGAIYVGYKYFAIKIVLLAPAHNVVPKIKNMRAIALT